jgi:hypothetical protein
MLADLRQQVADAEQIADVGERIYKLRELKNNVNTLRTTHRHELFNALYNTEVRGQNTTALGVLGGMGAGLLGFFSFAASSGAAAATTAAAAAGAAGTVVVSL